MTFRFREAIPLAYSFGGVEIVAFVHVLVLLRDRYTGGVLATTYLETLDDRATEEPTESSRPLLRSNYRQPGSLVELRPHPGIRNPYREFPGHILFVPDGHFAQSLPRVNVFQGRAKSSHLW